LAVSADVSVPGDADTAAAAGVWPVSPVEHPAIATILRNMPETGFSMGSPIRSDAIQQNARGIEERGAA
jgi:hypothetical protein